MKAINTRLKAFTIMELTIVMLISAIVIGITYTSFQIISKSYVGYNSKNNDMASVIRLDELLRKDFQQSEDITFSGQSVTFRDSLKLVNYDFAQNYVLRLSTETDTFKVRNDEFLALFEKHQVMAESSDNDQQPTIDELRFNVILAKDTLSYHYHKTYSSADLINIKANAGN